MDLSMMHISVNCKTNSFGKAVIPSFFAAYTQIRTMLCHSLSEHMRTARAWYGHMQARQGGTLEARWLTRWNVTPTALLPLRQRRAGKPQIPMLMSTVRCAGSRFGPVELSISFYSQKIIWLLYVCFEEPYCWKMCESPKRQRQDEKPNLLTFTPMSEQPHPNRRSLELDKLQFAKAICLHCVAWSSDETFL